MGFDDSLDQRTWGNHECRERNKEIYRLWKSGQSMKSIGEKFNLSGGFVSLVILRAEKPRSPRPKTRKELVKEMRQESELRRQEVLRFIGDKKDLYSKEGIELLSLSVRSYNCLKGHLIETIGELCSLSSFDLLQIPSLGRKSLNEIKEALEEIELFLRGKSNGI